MKRILFALALILVFSTATLAVEQFTLTTPITQPTITDYRVSSLHIDTVGQSVVIGLINDTTGQTLSFSYGGTLAVTRMNQLNTGNFSVNSLQKQIILMLVGEGKLPAGSVSGTPGN